MINDSSPFVFHYFWSICHILLDLSRQLGYSKGAYVARFLQSLHLSLELNHKSKGESNSRIESASNINNQGENKSINRGLADVISHLEPYFEDETWTEHKHQEQEQNTDKGNLKANEDHTRRRQDRGNEGIHSSYTQSEDEETRRRKKRERRKERRKERKEAKKSQIPNKQQAMEEIQLRIAEAQNIIRTNYQCAIRAFSTRRHPTDPNVLKIWADYCRHWDTGALNTAEFLQRCEEAFQKTKELYGPHHEYTIDVLCNYAVTAYYTCHANDLANALAIKLWDRTRDVINCGQPTWNAKTRGMAEAATIMGLSICIYHENMYKDSKARRKIRRKLGLGRKKKRRIWRNTLGPPPPPDQASSTLTRLDEAVKSLAMGDWDCLIVAQNMAYNLAGLLMKFCGPEEQYRQATSGHLERGNQCISKIFSDANPSAEANMLRVIENTISPAQLHVRSWPPFGSGYGGSFA